MNYILILLEVIFTFFLMFIFYKVGKKNGLYLYMVLMSSIASIIMFKTIDLFSFQVNLGIPIIMGLFICNNIIIQRFGIDEVKGIMTTSGIAYVVVGIIVSLLSLTINSDYVLTSNEVFNSLFGSWMPRCVYGDTVPSSKSLGISFRRIFFLVDCAHTKYTKGYTAIF